MRVNRRTLMAGLGSVAALGAASGLSTQAARALEASSLAPPELPAKSAFGIPSGITFLNSAYTHPMPLAGVEAAHRFAEMRAHPEAVMQPSLRANVKAMFASLINAKENEISYISSTSAGENLIVNGLRLDYSTDNVVTDALHFEGAILHLQALQQRFGLDVRIVKPVDWRIRLEDLERVIDKNTRLVEISLVAMDNGFQHDLKAVCDLAHAHGAYVYADIVQAAGCTPIDVRATGVDFCACSTFKWLMGDFGLGFLYIKEELLDKVVGRTQYGYYQSTKLESHFLPGDPPGPSAYTWELGSNAAAHFETGTSALGVASVLSASLPLIQQIGVERIEQYRQPMLKKLREEMPRLGFEPLTPPESKSALITFAVKDAVPLRERLKSARINVRVAEHFLRISPSVFNDLGDIDKLLGALA